MPTVREVLQDGGQEWAELIAISDQNAAQIDEQLMDMDAGEAFAIVAKLAKCRTDPSDLRTAPDNVLRQVARLTLETLIQSHVRLLERAQAGDLAGG